MLKAMLFIVIWVVLMIAVGYLIGKGSNEATPTMSPLPIPPAITSAPPTVVLPPTPTITREYRCVVTSAFSEFLPGVQTKIGEAAICGYELSMTNYLGPTLEAWISSGGVLIIHPIGNKRDAP